MIRNMFLTSLCRAYGAHNSMHILPTALPWANLPVRLTARRVWGGTTACAILKRKVTGRDDHGLGATVRYCTGRLAEWIWVLPACGWILLSTASYVVGLDPRFLSSCHRRNAFEARHVFGNVFETVRSWMRMLPHKYAAPEARRQVSPC